MQAWRKWLRLSWTDRAILTFGLCVLPIVVLLLRLVGYRRTHWVLERLSPQPRNNGLRNRDFAAATQIQSNVLPSEDYQIGSLSEPSHRPSDFPVPQEGAGAGHLNANLRQLRRYGDLANVAANHSLFAANCLPRSLYLWWFLRNFGWDSTIRFGAHKTETAIQAHAWVEYQGIPINDAEDVAQQYFPFRPAETMLAEELEA